MSDLKAGLIIKSKVNHIHE